MNKNEIINIIKSEIKGFIKDELDNEIKNTLHKSGSKSRIELINTIKDSLESVYKILWQKRDFWKSDIK